LLDDAAVIAALPGHELVAKTDAIVGGVHFLPDDPPALIARKALRVNLSDLASKGAVPRAYMLAAVLPGTITEEWIAKFAGGLAHDQNEYNVHLIGGDTASTPGPLTITIMAFGDVPTGRILRRGGARDGDTVFVTGTIGDAALGLDILKGGAVAAALAGDATARETLISRYRVPQPRNALAAAVRAHASAAMDVSDGLAGDLTKLCAASGVSATIDTSLVPLSTAAAGLLTRGTVGIETLIAGGDDYEILCAVPDAKAATLAAEAKRAGVALTMIGTIAAGTGARFLDPQGNEMPLQRLSYSHF
jgi:thiamine-monophosphate kinase